MISVRRESLVFSKFLSRASLKFTYHTSTKKSLSEYRSMKCSSCVRVIMKFPFLVSVASFCSMDMHSKSCAEGTMYIHLKSNLKVKTFFDISMVCLKKTFLTGILNYLEFIKINISCNPYDVYNVEHIKLKLIFMDFYQRLDKLERIHHSILARSTGTLTNLPLRLT